MSDRKGLAVPFVRSSEDLITLKNQFEDVEMFRMDLGLANDLQSHNRNKSKVRVYFHIETYHNPNHLAPPVKKLCEERDLHDLLSRPAEFKREI